MEHQINPDLLRGPVKTLVVGAGGTGSHVLTGLVQLHHAMVSLGHPGGLDVTVMDFDTVSPANIGRQMFFPCDIGKNKAQVLVNRINMAMGTIWEASSQQLQRPEDLSNYQLVIGCVDNRKTRQIIASYRNWQPAYWLDMGNTRDSGQVILGQIGKNKELPHVGDLFPSSIDPEAEGEDDTPSCSLAEALEKQSLFINRGMALYGLNLLGDLFRYGKIDYHGVFVNMKNARTSPLKIDPVAWERMGYLPAKKA